jgi:hypothetical protein
LRQGRHIVPQKNINPYRKIISTFVFDHQFYLITRIMAVSRRPPEIKTDKKYLFHLVFFVASIIIVVAISPRQGKFRYEFEKGKPWLQTSLIAPWDFPVLKPEDIITRERDSILNNFAPYFRLNPAVETTMISQFDKYLNDLLKVFEAETKPLNPMGFITAKRDLNLVLSSIYNKGILETNDITTATDQQYSEITVIKGKVVEEKQLISFYLQKTYQASEG